MHRSFEKHVVPLTLYVLGVMDCIKDSAGAHPAQDEIRPRLKNMLGRFNVRGPREQDFALAKSALVFWIDELLVNSDWVYAAEWRDNPLEREIYGSRNRAWLFFENAEYARSLEQTDALETFAQCVALGFHGIYRSESLRSAAQVNGRLGMDLQTKSSAPVGNIAHANGTRCEHSNGSGELISATSATAVLEPELTSGLPSDGNHGRPPLTREEWAAPLFSQLSGDHQPTFQPVTPGETPRDARPLPGRDRFVRWAIALASSALITLFILAVRGYMP
jgi:type VI secretion system protein ImpK